jgi:hypothetical protein
MHRPIQLTKTTSFPGTSQIIPDDNKGNGTRFPALIGGFRPALSTLARRIAFPLFFLTAGLVLIHLPSFRPADPEQKSIVNEFKLVAAKQPEPITALASQIQKVSSQLTLNEGAPRIVASDP